MKWRSADRAAGNSAVCLGLLAALVLVHGCAGATRVDQAAPTSRAQDELATLRDAAHGGLLLTEFRQYEGGRLYDYMNGAAETYFAHGFRRLTTCVARWGETEAIIELYRLATRANAAELLASFRGSGERQLQAGEEGLFWPGAEPEANIQRGPFFARIIVYGRRASAAESQLKTIVARVDRSLREHYSLQGEHTQQEAQHATQSGRTK